MKVIIAGSRTFKEKEEMFKVLDTFASENTIDEVVCGGAVGADAFGHEWAASRNIPAKIFKPLWEKYGRMAGYHRNVEMGIYADYLIAFWDGKSNGTKHMIDWMKSHGKHGFVVTIEEE